MVLFNVTGSMGSGKTTGAVCLTFKNWLFKRQRVFSNMPLFKIPYYFIDHIGQIASMKNGFVLLDEGWLIMDSRMSLSKRNRFSSHILSRSRKRSLTYMMTVQVLSAIDSRVRRVTDFTATPLLNAQETNCKILIFTGGYPKKESYMKSFYFKTPIIFDMFDTEYEIDMKDEGEDVEPKIIFQTNFNKEHGHFCKCKECGTKYFKTWEEADKYAENYWIENQKYLKYIF